MFDGGNGKRKNQKVRSLEGGGGRKGYEQSSDEEEEIDMYHDRINRKRQKSVSEQVKDWEEEDIFHLSSHPVYQDTESTVDDQFTIHALEATLHSSERPNQEDLIEWNGRTSKQENIVIKSDRYDILHLLDCLPQGSTLVHKEGDDQISISTKHISRSPSPIGGMSDLDSDTEDVFFLTFSESQSVRTEKQKRKLDLIRSERISQIEKEQEEHIPHNLSTNINEKITLDQFNLMKRTADALRKASNTQALEARILANHGNDSKFLFLSTKATERMKQTWKDLMESKEISLAEANEEENFQSLNNTLVAYDSSEEEEGDEGHGEKVEKPIPFSLAEEEDLEAKKKRKLELAREWSRKRQERLSQNAKENSK